LRLALIAAFLQTAKADSIFEELFGSALLSAFTIKQHFWFLASRTFFEVI
jgi:hypothetical protein